jgi:endo-1,4-beta-D-glucanase Y
MNPDDCNPPPPMPAPQDFDESEIFNVPASYCPPHMFRTLTKMGGGEFRSWWAVGMWGRN